MGLPSRTVGARATEDRWSGPSSDQGTYKRPSGANADGAATVRNVLPWRSVEKELAKRLAEKAAKGELPTDVPSAPSSVPRPRTPEREIDPPPDSGVRASVAGLRAAAPAEDSERGGCAPRALTYSMYTVSELDEARPAPMSTPRIAPPAPSEWLAVLASGQALGRVLWSWARLAKPRPPLKDHAAVPFATLRVDTWTALRAAPWRKIGWATLIAFGTVLLFLMAVVTVAELTDDLKPARGATTPKYSLATEPASVPPPVAAVRSFDGSAAAPELAQIELDDEPVTHPAVKAPVAKTKVRGKKAKPADIFLP